MRKFAVGIGISIALMQPAMLAGQDHPATTKERLAKGREEVREETPRIPSVEYQIYQRAALQARQRQARIDQRKWLGVSAQRTFIPADALATNVNGYSGWGYGPVWRASW